MFIGTAIIPALKMRRKASLFLSSSGNESQSKAEIAACIVDCRVGFGPEAATGVIAGAI
jgi:hypothetical protein